MWVGNRLTTSAMARLWWMVALAVVVSGVGCGAGTAAYPQTEAQASSQDEAKPFWAWSDQEIRDFWATVSPGRARIPTAWPADAMVAVALSFDFQMGTIYDANPASSVNTNSTYDGRVGIPRILRLLDRHDVPATFFTTGVTALLYPEVIRSIAASDRHEVGVHGWVHERTTDLDADDERRLLTKALRALEEVTGERPVGYRSPSWELSANTLGLLGELGFLYDSSMMADDEPYEILIDGQRTGLVEVPVEWVRDDAVYYRRTSPQSQDDVFDVWAAEFDMAYEEGGLFQLTMHPRISGHRARVAMLDRLIRHIKSRPGVWFATHEQVARQVSEHRSPSH